MKEKNEILEKLIKPIIGLPGRFKLGHGSFLTIDFGKEIEKEYMTRKGKQTAYYGQWHLWVYMCAWRIDHLGQPMIGSDDERDKITENLIYLNNKKLEQFIIINSAHDATLKFESDYDLKLFSFNVIENEYWKLYNPNNKTFTAGPGTQWRYTSSDE